MKFKTLIKIILGITIILEISYSVLRFGLSSSNIAIPAQDHSHFRIKYVFNGQEENFGSPRYQTDYTKDICDGTLTESPLHFHDNKPDYQHLHWAKMTGGQMLKFYGLNYIGGLDNYMGFKMDKLPNITPVPIYGDHLPEPRKDDKFWVFTGIQDDQGNWNYTKRSFEEFKNQDFETFFGVESQARKDYEEYTFIPKNPLFDFGKISAQAHSGVEHKTLDEEQKHLLEVAEQQNTENLNNQALTAASQNSSVAATTVSPSQTTSAEFDPITGQELKAINNFLGDVVIFVQPNEPTGDQIKSRFQNMVNLDKSSCGG